MVGKGVGKVSVAAIGVLKEKVVIGERRGD
jgi:hypothetical protein